MTDLPQESCFAEPSTQAPQMVWGSDSGGSFEPAAPTLPAQRSAAGLATATNQLLEALVAKRVPRVEGLRRRLEESLPADLAAMEEAVRLLGADMESLDFLAGRDAARLLEFLRQGQAVSAAANHLVGLAGGFRARHAIDAPVVRLVWIELVLEADSLRKRVRQGANWLAQMNQDLGKRRAAATQDVTRLALDELARRGTALHQRLQTVHRLCGHARSIHRLCEEILAQRTAFCATLQERVEAAAATLGKVLQPLLEAAGYRPLVPEELMGAIEARHAMQVALTQAAAQLMRLQASEQELAGQLAEMGGKAGSLA